MIGNLGNDTYYVDNAGDTVTEWLNENEGIDEIRSTITRQLNANVENLDARWKAAARSTEPATS